MSVVENKLSSVSMLVNVGYRLRDNHGLCKSIRHSFHTPHKINKFFLLIFCFIKDISFKVLSIWGHITVYVIYYEWGLISRISRT